jgi:hypothetical protein
MADLLGDKRDVWCFLILELRQSTSDDLASGETAQSDSGNSQLATRRGSQMKTNVSYRSEHHDETESGRPVLKGAATPQTIYAHFTGKIVNLDDIAIFMCAPPSQQLIN